MYRGTPDCKGRLRTMRVDGAGDTVNDLEMEFRHVVFCLTNVCQNLRGLRY